MGDVITLNQVSKLNFGKSIITWGVFDGVHRGHHKIVNDVVRWAKNINSASIILVFDKPPEVILYKKNISLLTSIKQRVDLINSLGVDYCIVTPFTKQFAKITARDFIQNILVKKLKTRGIVLGFDSSFGRNRKGNFDLLSKFAKELNIEVCISKAEMFKNKPISSSLIREMIELGQLSEATHLLGRAPSIIGTVIKGAGRGNKIGYPTANIKIEYGVKPPRGVYASEVLLNGRTFHSVTNIGVRPTFEQTASSEVIETYIVNFKNGNLYNKELEVRFLFKIRDEKKFSKSTFLKKQIEEDIAVFLNSKK